MPITVDGITSNGTIQLNSGVIRGDLDSSRENAVTRTNITQETGKLYAIPLINVRVFDAFQTLLGTAGSDDLGLTAGTVGSNSPYITAGDLKAAGATTRKARFYVMVPLEYVSGAALSMRLHAGMLTTVADTTCTLDLSVYKLGTDTAVGSDSVSTAAQSMNSATFANLDFVITPTGLVAGDWLDCQISVACNDAATGTVVEPAIAYMAMLATIKG